MNVARQDSRIGVQTQTYQNKAVQTPPSAANPQLDYADRFVSYQREYRREPRKDAAAGAAGGFAVGAYVGLVVGAAGGVAAPITIPASIIGGTAIGGLAGALSGRASRHHTARPDSLRKHVFMHMGLVAKRRHSDAIIAALKDAGVLSRGRNRRLVDLTNLQTALDNVLLSGRPLTLEQRQGVKDLLEVMADETERRRVLFDKVREVQKAITARTDEVIKRSGRRGLEVDAPLLDLRSKKEALYAELARLPSDLAVAAPLSSVPSLPPLDLEEAMMAAQPESAFAP